MSVRFNKLWSFESSGRAPIYSSPITASVGGEQCVIFQSWDWYIYVVRKSDGSVKWKFATGGPCYGRCQAADVDGDGHTEVFGASHDGFIYCLNYDGTLRWKVPNLYNEDGTHGPDNKSRVKGVATSATATTLTDTTQGWLTNMFLRIEGAGFGATLNIVSGTGSGQSREITGVNAATHTLTVATAWTTTPDATSHYTITPKYTSDVNFQHAGTLQQEGVGGTWRLYVGGFDNIMRKLNPSTGAVIWEFPSLENIEAFPVVAQVDGTATTHCTFGSIDGYCYCLNGDTGAQKWATKVDTVNGLGIDAVIQATDINGDFILEMLVPVRRSGLSGGGGKVHILKGTDGTDLGSTIDMGGDVDDRAVPVDNGSGGFNAVVGCDSGMVLCFDHTGATVWKQNFGQVFNSSPTWEDVDSDGVKEIVIGDMSGRLFLINHLTGEIKGSYLTDGPIEGIPCIDDETLDGLNMRIYVSNNAGTLVKLSVTPPPTLKITPDSQNYNTTAGKSVQSTQLDGGMPRNRLDQLGAAETIAVQWTTDINGYDYLRAFFRTATQFGSLPFLIGLVLDSHALTTYEASFVPDTFKLYSQQGLSYVVQATLSVKPLTPNTTADNTLMSNYVAAS